MATPCYHPVPEYPHIASIVLQVGGIFITHFHGDHCFGLGGVLMALSAAKEQQSEPSDKCIRLHGPPGLTNLVRAVVALAGAHQHITVPIYIIELVEEW
jgi:ribonuclease Z